MMLNIIPHRGKDWGQKWKMSPINAGNIMMSQEGGSGHNWVSIFILKQELFPSDIHVN